MNPNMKELLEMESSFHYVYTAAVLTVFFVCISVRFLLNRDGSDNRPPGPPALPVLGHLYLTKKPLHRSLSLLADRYGPVVGLRLGSRSALAVSSPAAAEDCLAGNNDALFANRPRVLIGRHLAYDYTTIAWAPYGPLWRELRRIAAVEILAASRLTASSAVRREEVAAMARRIARDANGLGKISVKPRLYEVTYNAMMRMIAGRRCYGEEADDAAEARKFHEIVEETFELGGASSIGDFVPFMRAVDWGGLGARLIRLQAKRDAFFQRYVDDHRKQGSGNDETERRRKTIIDVLLSLQRIEPEYYTDKIVKGVVMTLMTAGTDTSAITMEWALSLLLNHPEALNKVRAEIDLQVGPDRLIEESDLPNLPYLHCVIKETLRLYPVTPIIPAHESSADCKVGGFDVPSGTTLLINVWAIQRDPSLWPDATSFKPERFEGTEGQRDGYKLMPFGSGRRACPGEGLAMRLVGLALGALVQCFEWEGTVDLKERVGITMIKAEPLEAMCKRRPFVTDDFLCAA